MSLSNRKKMILQALVDDYIATAEPVGSRTIVKRHDIGLSPATIRNEMADLEELGYLDKPHTSAGRIPSHEGYRFYVDSLMQEYRLSTNELQRLHSMMEFRLSEIDRIISKASEAIAKLSEYTTFAMAPVQMESYIKSIRLLLIETCNMLMFIVTNEGLIKNRAVKVSANVSEEYLKKLSEIINAKISGLRSNLVNLTSIFELKQAVAEHGEIIEAVDEFIKDAFEQKAKVYLDGAANIFKYPEYRDLDRAREFLNFIDDEENLQKIMLKSPKGKTVVISIGDENEIVEMKDSSLIMAHYDAGKGLTGKIGIVGPTRMDYSKIVSYLRCISDGVSKMIKDIY